MIVDFEGYQSYDSFYVKEIAIYNCKTRSSSNYFCSTQLIKKDSTYYWIIKNHHKIPQHYGNYSFKKIVNELNKAEKIYCKGLSKKYFLEKFIHSPVIDLEQHGCPKLANLPTQSATCAFHCNNIHCALEKVNKIAGWLNKEN